MEEPLFHASENPNPVMRLDLEGRLIYANDAASVLVKQWGISLGDRVPSVPLAFAKTAFGTNKVVDLEVSAHEVVYLLKLAPYLNRGYLNIYGFDISIRKQYLNELQHLEQHDPLTSLPNKQSLLERLDHVISEGNKRPSTSILLVKVNQLYHYGRLLGGNNIDQLTVLVSKRLKEALSQDLHLSRVGDDLFAVIVDNLESVEELSAMCEVIIDNLSEVYVIDSHDVVLSSNIGVAKAIDCEDNSRAIIQSASFALDESKKSGKNHYSFYKHQQLETDRAKQALLRDLQNSVSNDELLLYYQPQINLESNEIVGAEALIRWNHPKFGLLTPGRFTELAEESGFIVKMGDWVIKQAAKTLAKWQRDGYSDMSVAVNVSPSQFNEHLCQVVEDAIVHHQINPANLELEILEGVVIGDWDYAISLLKKLSRLGVKLAIDDFGTGYSSLSYLHQLPVNKIKIDRSFVMDISKEESKQKILDTIVALGHSLKMSVLAEGIENDFQRNYLSQITCDYAQGYLISAPIPQVEFENMLLRSRSEDCE